MGRRQLLLVLCLVFNFGCANKADREKMANEEKRLSGPIPGVHGSVTQEEKILDSSMVTTVNFKKDENDLSATARKHIDRAISEARSKGAIDRIDIAVWSDEEYPDSKKKLSDSDIKLAKERGDSVKKYLVDLDKHAKISIHNMAKEPNALSEILGTRDAKVKKSLAESELTEDKSETSKALILFKLK